MGTKDDMELEPDNFNEEEDAELEDSKEATKEKDVSEEELAFGSARERQRIREAMAAEVEAFLASGGRIQEVEPNVVSDPPRKPQTSYGSRPI